MSSEAFLRNKRPNHPVSNEDEAESGSFHLKYILFSVITCFAIIGAFTSSTDISSFLVNGTGLFKENYSAKSASVENLEPLVILISSDGFRWGYQFKAHTPNIDRLRFEGTEASLGLIPVYPSVTFPNHYSIVTGLYPGSHGIIENSFRDPQNLTRKFTMRSKEPEWWLGEPIWETVVKQGKKAATYFWPGSEVKHKFWDCPKQFCKNYNGAIPFERRVDEVLGWVDLPPSERPQMITLYFDEPDHTGHQFGPDAPQIDSAILKIDAQIGRLLNGLEKRGILDKVNVILLGDHGMVSNCNARQIYVEDFKAFLPGVSPAWFESYSPMMAIIPSPGTEASAIVAGFRNGSASGTVPNSQFLSVFLKEELPGRFNYSGNRLIAPVIGVVSEGYTLRYRRAKSPNCDGGCFGSHGYDNALLSMRTVFFARGPNFHKGRSVESFRNVEVYAIIAEILGVSPAPHNGSEGFPKSILV